jgi:hypothetical protein
MFSKPPEAGRPPEPAKSPESVKRAPRTGRWIAIAAGSAIVVTGALALAFLLSKVGASYRVQAAFHRDGPGGDETLPAGSRLASGDMLSLDIDLSRRCFVYVLRENDRGDAFLLFPLPGFDQTNPLEPGRHRLPPRLRGGLGPRSGWRLTGAGGRERFLIVASPQPLLVLEDAARRPPEVVEGRPAAVEARLGLPTLQRLRAAGSLAGVEERPARGAAGDAVRLAPAARELGPEAEEVRGVWVRAVEFENPR